MPETDLGSRVNEYYQRALRLKPLILADHDMLNRIRSIRDHQYHQGELDESVELLGEGSSNNIYNIGSVTDPETQREIPIAIRLDKVPSLLDVFLSQLERELEEYEAAHALGENTPYFVSVVTFPYDDKGDIIFAILTEDISKKKALPLKTIDGDYSRVKRTNEDGSTQPFFIDPVQFKELYSSYGLEKVEMVKSVCSGGKYLADKARIDL